MNINEAIKIKEDTLCKRYLHHQDLIDEADKLGIEALKREQSRRRYLISSRGELLPGETEEC